MSDLRDEIGKLIYETYGIIAPGLLDDILALLESEVNDTTDYWKSLTKECQLNLMTIARDSLQKRVCELQDKLDLLSSLKGWVKVCEMCDKGTIRTPLQWEDVPWNLALDIALYNCPDSFRTKSGERIEREK